MKALDLAKAVGAVPCKNENNFTLQLFRLILKADVVNRAKLAKVYPTEVKMAHRFSMEDGCIVDPEHPELGGYRPKDKEGFELVKPWEE